MGAERSFKDQLALLRRRKEGEPVTFISREEAERAAFVERHDKQVEVARLRDRAFLEEIVRPIFEAINTHYLQGRGEISNESLWLPEYMPCLQIAWDTKKEDSPDYRGPVGGDSLTAFMKDDSEIVIMPGADFEHKVAHIMIDKPEEVWKPQLEDAVLNMISSDADTKWGRAR